MKIGNISIGDLSAVRRVFSSLHSRNYRLYFVGQGVSLVGTWMQNVALSWLVYRLTGSVFLLGVIGFTSQIPTFVLSPFTGVLTDRSNRLRMMILTQACFALQAGIMTALVLLGAIQVWHIIALSLVFGVISAFDAPVRQSLVIDLIDRPADLGNAIALNSAIFNAARLIGPAIAGITIAAVGEGICFLLNAVSFVAVIAALSLIRIPARPALGSAPDFKKSLREGFHYTFGSIPIRTLIIVLTILSFVSFSYIILLPAYAKEILQGGSDTLGYLMSAMGAGALVAALYMAARRTVIGLGRIIAFAMILMGVAIGVGSFSHSLGLSLVVFFFGGLCMVLSLSSINTMLQTIADEDKRGRVMSFYAMAVMGTTPIGNLVAGSLASGIGILHTFLICGLITLGAGIWFRLNLQHLRKYVRPIYVDKGILPALPHDLS